MEGLFILFVLYMIFSAILRAVRAAARQKTAFPPPLQAPPFSREQEADLTEETTTWLSTEAPESFSREQDLFPMELPQGAAEHAQGPGAKEPPREALTPALRQQYDEAGRAARKKKVRKITAAKRERGILMLIQGKNLPMAVVAGEVLSNPRSQRPHARLKAGVGNWRIQA